MGEIYASRPNALSWLREAFADAFDTVIYTMHWPPKPSPATYEVVTAVRRPAVWGDTAKGRLRRPLLVSGLGPVRIQARDRTGTAIVIDGHEGESRLRHLLAQCVQKRRAQASTSIFIEVRPTLVTLV